VSKTPQTVKVTVRKKVSGDENVNQNNNLTLHLDEDKDDLRKKAAKKLRLKEDDLKNLRFKRINRCT
jgi:hypothetical protein